MICNVLIFSTLQSDLYQVTQEQWRYIMESDPPKLTFRGNNGYPVESVSWNDVQRFVERLNQLSGKGYRLPTEAEWEFAAMGGIYSQGYVYAGSDKLKQVGWCVEKTRYEPRKIGMLLSNEIGLYDMSGNVYEWCQDMFRSDYLGAPIDGSARIEDLDHDIRVIRGGSFGSAEYFCRSKNRNWCDADKCSAEIGFRLAL